MFRSVRAWLLVALSGGMLVQPSCFRLQRELDVLFSPTAFDSLLFIPLSVVAEFFERFALR